MENPSTTGFDYEKGMERATRELNFLTEMRWSKYLMSLDEYQRFMAASAQLSTIQKAGRIALSREDNVSGTPEGRKLYMLREIVCGFVWHAVDFWPEMKYVLGSEDYAFYGRLIVERAKNLQDVQSGQPAKLYGNCFLVESYDNSKLKEFISDEQLRESVNRGFWEVANDSLVPSLFPALGFTGNTASRRFQIISKHMDLLDLERIDEFYHHERLVGFGWVNSGYTDAFRRAAKKMPLEPAGKLASPIIEKAANDFLHGDPNDGSMVSERSFENRIAAFRCHIRTQPVQQMLLEKAKSCAKEGDIAKLAVISRHLCGLKIEVSIPAMKMLRGEPKPQRLMSQA